MCYASPVYGLKVTDQGSPGCCEEKVVIKTQKSDNVEGRPLYFWSVS